MSLKIKDIPQFERPIERLKKYGVSSLSNAELIAIILRTGNKNSNVIELSNQLISNFNGIKGIVNASLKELKDINGIGDTKGAQIIALGELTKRINTFKSGSDFKISSPKDAALVVLDDMKTLNQEILRVIILNTKNIVLKTLDVSMGSINSSIVHPREVFKEAIKFGAASIIICHNHPSGDPHPSKEDIEITKRLKSCGELLGITLLDHLIIGDGVYVSLKEKGIV